LIERATSPPARVPEARSLRHEKESPIPTKLTRTAAKARNAKVIAGIDKDLANVQVQLAGEPFTLPSLKAVFQAETAAMNATDDAKKVYEKALLDEKAARARTAAVLSALRSFLIGYFGKHAVTILGDFDMNAPKTATRTVPAKAVAVAKAKATRAARGTKGPVAKLATTGTVDEAAIKAAIESPATPPPKPEPGPAVVTPVK
jgi:hypothetical protein